MVSSGDIALLRGRQQQCPDSHRMLDFRSRGAARCARDRRCRDRVNFPDARSNQARCQVFRAPVIPADALLASLRFVVPHSIGCRMRVLGGNAARPTRPVASPRKSDGHSALRTLAFSSAGSIMLDDGPISIKSARPVVAERAIPVFPDVACGPACRGSGVALALPFPQRVRWTRRRRFRWGDR
jgi:hypothetical protein